MSQTIIVMIIIYSFVSKNRSSLYWQSRKFLPVE